MNKNNAKIEIIQTKPEFTELIFGPESRNTGGNILLRVTEIPGLNARRPTLDDYDRILR